MAFTWREQEPENIPLVLYRGEDFVRDLAFDKQINTFPSDTTITLMFFDGTDPDATLTGAWPATVGATTAWWSVDHEVADEIPAPGGYRLMLSLPNPADPENPTVERCLALGSLKRK